MLSNPLCSVIHTDTGFRCREMMGCSTRWCTTKHLSLRNLYNFVQ